MLLVIIIGCINIIILFVLLFIKLYDDISNPCLSCKYKHNKFHQCNYCLLYDHYERKKLLWWRN